jgi:hypothetical protein
LEISKKKLRQLSWFCCVAHSEEEKEERRMAGLQVLSLVLCTLITLSNAGCGKLNGPSGAKYDLDPLTAYVVLRYFYTLKCYINP